MSFFFSVEEALKFQETTVISVYCSPFAEEVEYTDDVNITRLYELFLGDLYV